MCGRHIRIWEERAEIAVLLDIKYCLLDMCDEEIRRFYIGLHEQKKYQKTIADNSFEMTEKKAKQMR